MIAVFFSNMRMKMMTIGWIFLTAVLIISLGGCSNSLYQLDMAKHRRANLLKDLNLLCPKSPADLPSPLTLDDAVLVGMRNNLDLRISRIMEDISDENALMERLKMLPQVNLNSSISQSSASSDPDADKATKTMSLSLTWNILDFGLSYIRARQSAMRAEIRSMERTRQAQMLAAQIASAYWQTILAEQSLEQIQTIETEVRGYKERTELLVSQKRLDPIVSKAIEKKIVELAITASDLRAEISGAKIELCRLMGISPMTEITLERIPFQEHLEKLPSPGAFDPLKLEMISLTRRPEFYAEDLELRIQQDEARSALVSMLPGAQLNFGNYYNSNSSYANNMWASWGHTLTSALLSLPSQYVNWRSQKKNVAMVELQRLLLTSGVIVEVHMALHDYMVKDRQFRLYDDSYGIAEDLLSMSRERHELGLLSDWALTQRMLEDVVARLSRDRRIIDLFNAYNTLLVTMGLEYTQWGDDVLEMDAGMPAADVSEDAESSEPGEEDMNRSGDTRQMGDYPDVSENMMLDAFC